MNPKALFDAIREIKGSALTQAEVDAVNCALGETTAAASKCGMAASPTGVTLIHSFETLVLRAYPDPGSKDGKPVTNGWGTTRDEGGGPIKLGAVWTREKADRLFARDLRDVEVGVNLLLRGKATTQAQFDALVAFAYNVGLTEFGTSTLLRLHLAGDFGAWNAKAGTGTGAVGQFPRWNKNDGKVMAGLVRRRAAEAALYAA